VFGRFGKHPKQSYEFFAGYRGTAFNGLEAMADSAKSLEGMEWMALRLYKLEFSEDPMNDNRNHRGIITVDDTLLANTLGMASESRYVFVESTYATSKTDEFKITTEITQLVHGRGNGPEGISRLLHANPSKILELFNQQVEFAAYYPVIHIGAIIGDSKGLTLRKRRLQ
jgi:hypothetical protein